MSHQPDSQKTTSNDPVPQAPPASGSAGELRSPADSTAQGRTAPQSPAAPAFQFDKGFYLKIGLQAAAVFAVGVVLILMVGIGQRFGWIGTSGPAATADSGNGETIYTCPMHPQIRQPEPGRCPICAMALEPATTDTAADLDEFAVHIEPAHRRLANIQTAEVERRPVTYTPTAVGSIAFDESRSATIAAYVDGRIERLFADYTGVRVEKGDPLAVLYSPSLYGAQVEYLESRRTRDAMSDETLPAVRRSQQRLVESARQRLVEFGMTESQISEIEQSGQAMSRLTIYAPIGGTVIEKPAVEGNYVRTGEPIYRIAHLSTVWLMLQLFPEDAARIRFGQQVEAELRSRPRDVFSGRVAFVDPVVTEKTRTIGVRIEMPNPEGKLRPGEYATAKVRIPLGAEGEVYDAGLAGKWISPMHPQIIRDEPGECPICGMDLVSTTRYGYAEEAVPQPEVLTVPRNAVLTAAGHSLVYVETEPGRFEIRPVKLGPLLRDVAVIVEGVEEGESVATSGNFLIDSQMQIAGKPSLIDPTRAIARPPEKNAPLELEEFEARPVSGVTGRRLEELYRTYFAVQEAFAADRIPAEAEIDALESAGTALVEADDLPDEAQPDIETILENAGHLRAEDIDHARDHFKPVSHAIVRLAARYRSDEAEEPLIHFWCSMVSGGGGDWLQAGHPPANPYWGSKMLRCVQHESELPLPVEEETPADDT